MRILRTGSAVLALSLLGSSAWAQIPQVPTAPPNRAIPPRTVPPIAPPANGGGGGAEAIGEPGLPALAVDPQFTGRVLQIHAGNGGRSFDLWSKRSIAAPSKHLGRLVITTSSLPVNGDARWKRDSEHFIWFAGQPRWPVEFFLKLANDNIANEAIPADAVVETYPNNVDCYSVTNLTSPGVSQWGVVVEGQSPPNPAVLAKQGGLFVGYWRTSTRCAPLTPSIDGWVNLVPAVGQQAAKSYGTRPAR
jgi:hypothetical protein